MKGIKKEGSMIDEYFNIYTEHVKEYGEKTVILYQCGSFLEMYEIDNKHEKIGNARILSICFLVGFRIMSAPFFSKQVL